MGLIQLALIVGIVVLGIFGQGGLAVFLGVILVVSIL